MYAAIRIVKKVYPTSSSRTQDLKDQIREVTSMYIFRNEL